MTNLFVSIVKYLESCNRIRFIRHQSPIIASTVFNSNGSMKEYRPLPVHNVDTDAPSSSSSSSLRVPKNLDLGPSKAETHSLDDLSERRSLGDERFEGMADGAAIRLQLERILDKLAKNDERLARLERVVEELGQGCWCREKEMDG